MLHGSPWVYVNSNCPQMITQQYPKGPQGCWRSTKIFHGQKMTNSSQVDPQGGVDVGKLEIAPRTSVIGQSVHTEKNHSTWVWINTQGPQVSPTPVQLSPKPGLLGPISTTMRAYLVLHGSPWVYTHTHCHQMITKQWHKGPCRSSKVTQKLRFSSQPMLA